MYNCFTVVRVWSNLGIICYMCVWCVSAWQTACVLFVGRRVHQELAAEVLCNQKRWDLHRLQAGAHWRHLPWTTQLLQNWRCVYVCVCVCVMCAMVTCPSVLYTSSCPLTCNVMYLYSFVWKHACPMHVLAYSNVLFILWVYDRGLVQWT